MKVLDLSVCDKDIEILNDMLKRYGDIKITKKDRDIAEVRADLLRELIDTGVLLSSLKYAIEETRG